MQQKFSEVRLGSSTLYHRNTNLTMGATLYLFAASAIPQLIAMNGAQGRYHDDVVLYIRGRMGAHAKSTDVAVGQLLCGAQLPLLTYILDFLASGTRAKARWMLGLVAQADT